MDNPVEFAFQNGVINEETKALAKQKLEESYYALLEVLKDYIDTTEHNYKIMALWIIGTYFHERFSTYPYLFLNAMRGSGKTRALKLISALGAKGDGSVQNNLTEAVLFRIPRGTTTCIDEIEQIGSKDKQTLRELLNSAYKKGMKVKRMRKMHTKEGEQQVTETYEPYFPIAMANIWGIEEVLGDRSLSLILEKSDNPSNVLKIEDFDSSVVILELKRILQRISVVSVDVVMEKTYIRDWNNYIRNRYNHISTLTTFTTFTTLNYTNYTNIDKDLEREEFFNKIHDSEIRGRNLELTLPLLVVAKNISNEVFNDAFEVISQVVKIKREDEYQNSKDVSVYDFVSSISSEGFNYLPLKELTQRFRIFLGESDEEDRWLNDKWFGRALKRLNLLLDKKRMARGMIVMLNYTKAKEKVKIFKIEEKKDDNS